MNNIKFQDYKDKIITALTRKGYSFVRKTGVTQIDDSYSLIDSFINQPIQNEISGNVIIGGPSLPMIVIIHNGTGRLEFFALKALLPDIQL